MPEPISTLMLGYAALHVATIPVSAVSREASAVRGSAGAVMETLERSLALFGAKSAALSDIFALAEEFAEGGWDGDGGNPVSPLAISMAAAFIRAMPDSAPLPEFAPEPDGSISLDWIETQNRVFSITLGVSNRIAYAWLDGSDKGHGVERFYGDKIPSRILDGIRLIVGDKNASFRVA